MDLVVMSLESWDSVWRRNQHLVAGLLRDDPELRVLFVEPSVDPLYATVTMRRPQRGRGLRRVPLGDAVPRLWTYQATKWLPRRFDHRADERQARAVLRAVDGLGFSEPILWINDPGGATLLEVTGWPALYDITDDWLEAVRTPAEHRRLVHEETLLLSRCAEVVVCSPELARRKGAMRPVSLIPNAVDARAYRTPRARPADLPDGPVALYLGTVHTDRIDLQLCEATARALDGRGRLVLVGPAPLAASDMRELAKAGVVLLGAKDRDDVPGYLQHADVLVVPHVVTPFTESLDPIKAYEYRAVGRPVVSTPVAGFRDSGDPRVVVASGADFVDSVRERVPATTRFPDGVADDDVPTWEVRVREMGRILTRIDAARRQP